MLRFASKFQIFWWLCPQTPIIPGRGYLCPVPLSVRDPSLTLTQYFCVATMEERHTHPKLPKLEHVALNSASETGAKIHQNTQICKLNFEFSAGYAPPNRNPVSTPEHTHPVKNPGYAYDRPISLELVKLGLQI